MNRLQKLHQLASRDRGDDSGIGRHYAQLRSLVLAKTNLQITLTSLQMISAIPSEARLDSIFFSPLSLCSVFFYFLKKRRGEYFHCFIISLFRESYDFVLAQLSRVAELLASDDQRTLPAAHWRLLQLELRRETAFAQVWSLLLSRGAMRSEREKCFFFPFLGRNSFLCSLSILLVISHRKG